MAPVSKNTWYKDIRTLFANGSSQEPRNVKKKLLVIWGKMFLEVLWLNQLNHWSTNDASTVKLIKRSHFTFQIGPFWQDLRVELRHKQDSDRVLASRQVHSDGRIRFHLEMNFASPVKYHGVTASSVMLRGVTGLEGFTFLRYKHYVSPFQKRRKVI